MNALDRYFGIHASALQLRSKRVELIASNIANAATPNYKARDIDFEAALSSASGDGAMRATSAMHLQPSGGGGAGGDPLYRMPMQTSLDGNTVELASEQTEFAENAVRYQTTLSFLNGRISTLMSAIKGQ